MKNRPQIKITVAILLVVLTLAIIEFIKETSQTTGQQSVTALKSLPAWTNDLALTDNELPSGWKYDSVMTFGMPGGVYSQHFEFYNTNAGRNALATLGVYLTEEFGLYSTPIVATQFYTSWVDIFIPPKVVAQGLDVPEPQLEFPHHADQMTISCFIKLAYPSFRTCTAVARYQNVILHMHGTVFDDRWLTMSDFRVALEAADRRIVSVLSR